MIKIAFVEQTTVGDYMFVDWGELGEGHDKETNVVVKEGEYIEGIVEGIRENENYGRCYILRSKKYDKPLYLKGSYNLNGEMGYFGDIDLYKSKYGEVPKRFQDVRKILEGDVVRVTYHGKRNNAYQITVAVDDGK